MPRKRAFPRPSPPPPGLMYCPSGSGRLVFITEPTQRCTQTLLTYDLGTTSPQRLEHQLDCDPHYKPIGTWSPS